MRRWTPRRCSRFWLLVATFGVAAGCGGSGRSFPPPTYAQGTKSFSSSTTGWLDIHASSGFLGTSGRWNAPRAAGYSAGSSRYVTYRLGEQELEIQFPVPALYVGQTFFPGRTSDASVSLSEQLPEESFNTDWDSAGTGTIRIESSGSMSFSGVGLYDPTAGRAEITGTLEDVGFRALDTGEFGRIDYGNREFVPYATGMLRDPVLEWSGNQFEITWFVGEGETRKLSVRSDTGSLRYSPRISGLPPRQVRLVDGPTTYYGTGGYVAIVRNGNQFDVTFQNVQLEEFAGIDAKYRHRLNGFARN